VREIDLKNVVTPFEAVDQNSRVWSVTAFSPDNPFMAYSTYADRLPAAWFEPEKFYLWNRDWVVYFEEGKWCPLSDFVARFDINNSRRFE
jgi:hypothetical protein